MASSTAYHNLQSVNDNDRASIKFDGVSCIQSVKGSMDVTHITTDNDHPQIVCYLLASSEHAIPKNIPAIYQLAN